MIRRKNFGKHSFIALLLIVVLFSTFFIGAFPMKKQNIALADEEETDVFYFAGVMRHLIKRHWKKDIPMMKSIT